MKSRRGLSSRLRSFAPSFGTDDRTQVETWVQDRSCGMPAEESDQVRGDSLRRVLLEEMPGFGDELQLRLRDPRMEPVRALDRYPSVLLAPEDEDRKIGRAHV